MKNQERAFLSFALGPVQPFIEAARSVRDLWCGSYILAWLTYQAMEPIRKRAQATGGRDALEFVFPSLEGHPWETQEQSISTEVDMQFPGDTSSEKSTSDFLDQLLSPCLPNRFLAIVPVDEVNQLAEQCELSMKAAWKSISDRVFQVVSDKIVPNESLLNQWQQPSIRKSWNEQVASYFEVRTVVLARGQCDETELRQLLDDKVWATLPDSRADRDYQLHWRLMQGLLAASRNVRHVPAYRAVSQLNLSGDAEKDIFPVKCSVLGSYEQIGPAELRVAAKFWDALSQNLHLGAVRIRKQERFCAISLIKRFAWPAYFVPLLSREYGQTFGDYFSPPKRVPDTATVAASLWLNAPQAVFDPSNQDMQKDQALRISPDEEMQKRRDGDDVARWSGQWLHWQSPNMKDESDCPEELWNRIQQKKQIQGPPPVYYAILKMDGDKMGKKLEHAAQDIQTVISGVMSQFALSMVRPIIRSHGGALIYCGGDDVLALLPVARAIHCAYEVQEAFAQFWSQQLGKHRQRLQELGLTNDLIDDFLIASASAGVAVVHYKEDLRFALQQARDAEDRGKNSGRNSLTINACRHSGVHASVTIPWEMTTHVQKMVNSFISGMSDGWAYRLAQDAAATEGLAVLKPREPEPATDVPGESALMGEIRRQIQRSEEETKAAFGESIPDLFQAYVAWRRDPDEVDQRKAERPIATEPGKLQPTEKQLRPRRWPRDAGFLAKFPTHGDRRRELTRRAFRDFITLCQTASFLARGRDQ